MDEKEVNFSLSYEQLTRIAEERIRECNLDSQGAIYISEFRDVFSAFHWMDVRLCAVCAL